MAAPFEQQLPRALDGDPAQAVARVHEALAAEESLPATAGHVTIGDISRNLDSVTVGRSHPAVHSVLRAAGFAPQFEHVGNQTVPVFSPEVLEAARRLSMGDNPFDVVMVDESHRVVGPLAASEFLKFPNALTPPMIYEGSLDHMGADGSSLSDTPGGQGETVLPPVEFRRLLSPAEALHVRIMQQAKGPFTNQEPSHAADTSILPPAAEGSYPIPPYVAHLGKDQELSAGQKNVAITAASNVPDAHSRLDLDTNPDYHHGDADERPADNDHEDDEERR